MLTNEEIEKVERIIGDLRSIAGKYCDDSCMHGECLYQDFCSARSELFFFMLSQKRARAAYLETTKENEMEDKKQITQMLLPVLQATDNLSDLVALEYTIGDSGYPELVIATFANGSTKVANVSADSGTALIKDVICQIV